MLELLAYPVTSYLNVIDGANRYRQLFDNTSYHAKRKVFLYKQFNFPAWVIRLDSLALIAAALLLPAPRIPAPGSGSPEELITVFSPASRFPLPASRFLILIWNLFPANKFDKFARSQKTLPSTGSGWASSQVRSAFSHEADDFLRRHQI
ncbi:MAG: hypothetical protein LC633_06370 [Desulfobulbaceae bacterium]|nr:hypothetical protein [Desulfobulbaceae bacterium]